MVLKKRNTWIIVATLVVFIYLFFFYPQKRYYFKDTNLFQNALSTRINVYSLRLISPLLPANASNIRVFYRSNRIRNITIRFDASSINWVDYIGFVRSHLNHYSSSPSSIKESDKYISFSADQDSYFKQIDITLDENFITIQSY